MTRPYRLYLFLSQYLRPWAPFLKWGTSGLCLYLLFLGPDSITFTQIESLFQHTQQQLIPLIGLVILHQLCHLITHYLTYRTVISSLTFSQSISPFIMGHLFLLIGMAGLLEVGKVAYFNAPKQVVFSGYIIQVSLRFIGLVIVLLLSYLTPLSIGLSLVLFMTSISLYLRFQRPYFYQPKPTLMSLLSPTMLLLLSMTCYAILAAQYWLLLSPFTTDISGLLLATFLIQVSCLIPISWMGIGVREQSGAYLLGQLGVPFVAAAGIPSLIFWINTLSLLTLALGSTLKKLVPSITTFLKQKQGPLMTNKRAF
ncbi:MAG: hypothetical protein CL521_00995 [Actinobacteria bacterium]|nr:hypothetical protein [Actinomycetota bacterium]